MIEIRCKACNRVNLEVSEDARGKIKTRCKRASCGRWIEVTLPLKSSGQTRVMVAPVERASMGLEKVIQV